MRKGKKGLALLVAVVVLCAAVLPLSSCGTAEKRAYTLPKTLTITDETVADGREITVTVTANGGTFAIKQDGKDWWYEETYDGDGNRTVHRYYEFGELRTEVTYRYDKDGKETSWKRYDLYDGRSSGKYTYDDAGDLTEEVCYGGDGKLRWTRTFEYDENGRNVRVEDYDRDGKLSFGYTYEYDADGRLLKAWAREEYVEEYCHYAYTYDASGNVLTDAMYNTDGSLFKQIAYTYDESGREVEKAVSYGDGGVFERTVTVYEADGSRTVRSYDADGMETQTVYRYGEGGKVTEKGEYDEHGMLGWWYVYTYDENGLPAKRSGRLGAGEDVLLCSEVTKYQTVSLTEAQYQAFAAQFEETCGWYFS